MQKRSRSHHQTRSLRVVFKGRPSGASVALAQRLRDPMTFCDWMERCLYDPDAGYYMRSRQAPRTGAGPDADFATSPTLHPFLAQCIAAEIASAWIALGRCDEFRVVEYGGGEGDLARDALAALQDRYGWQPPWHHVEISPDHVGKQQAGEMQHGPPPDRFTGCVVAHEFLDALPVHLMEWRKGHWAEVYVALQDDGWSLQTGFPTQAGTDAAPNVAVPEGHRVAAHAGAKRWFQDVGQQLQAGRVIVVDYGAQEDVWFRDPAWGTIRTFRNQQHGSSPLDDPGEQDITASLDFSQLRAWAAAAGLKESWQESQESFLLRHGALEELNAVDRTTVEGASTYLRLRQLLLPTAMGEAFRVAAYEKGMG